MADRYEQVSCVNNQDRVQSAFFCWFNLNKQMLVLRPSMIDLMIHFDSPSLFFLLWILFRSCAKSKMLAPSVSLGPFLWTCSLEPIAQSMLE